MMTTEMGKGACGVAAACALAIAAAWAGQQGVAAQGAKASPAGDVARGKYLVNGTGCHDCHTPWKLGPNGPEPDMSRMLMGHPAGVTVPPPPPPSGPWIGSSTDTNTAFAGPWGVSYTRNLTPDVETGIGSWTEQQFVETIRNGRSQGRGRQLLPPMPWPVYRNLTDADLKAMFAYLKTLPAISNKVPEPVIAGAAQ